MVRSILNRWWWRLLVGLGCCWMQHENSWIMISPVPAIFLLPVLLIIDGILTDFSFRLIGRNLGGRVEHEKLSDRSGKATDQSFEVLTEIVKRKSQNYSSRMRKKFNVKDAVRRISLRNISHDRRCMCWSVWHMGINQHVQPTILFCCVVSSSHNKRVILPTP